MSYIIALSPDIGLSAEEFVAAWNQDPECQQAAQAQLASANGAAFDPALAGVLGASEVEAIEFLRKAGGEGEQG